MEAARLHRLETLFEVARELPPAERTAYLEAHCDSDGGLRADVEALLAQHDGGVLDGAAVQNYAILLTARHSLTTLAGQSIGHYQVLQLLGAGGMGEVWLAEDTRLGRQVALKLLPRRLAMDIGLAQRLTHEARAASALNHPNILTVHDVGEHDGQPYVVSEYVEGRSLREKLRGGPLTFTEAVDIALQVADGLSAAHSVGLVHRDIKPENIMVRPDGRVKVLDFDIAKRITAERNDQPLNATIPGTVLGTIAYLSPEQARGESIDVRSDIWSLGVVLYEMASGRHPFEDRTAAAIVDGILNRTPIPINWNPVPPPELECVIRKALMKDPNRRYQSALEMEASLKHIRTKPSSGKFELYVRSSASNEMIVSTASKQNRPLPSRGKAWRTYNQWWIWVSAATVLTLIIAYVLGRPMPIPRVSGYFQVTNDGQGKGPILGALVTDGSRIYLPEGWVSAPVLAQVSVTGGETAAFQTSFELPELLDISPGRSELLIAAQNSGYSSEWPLWSLPLPVGRPRRLGNIAAASATWSPDGSEIAYVRGRELYKANRDGTGTRKLLSLPGTAWWLRWSPDGSRFRFTVGDVVTKTGKLSIWEASAEASGLHSVFPRWNNPPTACCGNWSPDGEYYAFQATRDGRTEVWAARERTSLFNSFHKSPQEPFRLTSGQLNSLAPVFSPDGKKLYVVGQQLRGELVRYESKSHRWIPYLNGISAESLSFSRDGKWLSYVTFPDGILWRSRTDGTDRLQLTIAPMQALLPSWSPDGNQIAFIRLHLWERLPGSLGRYSLSLEREGLLKNWLMRILIKSTRVGLPMENQ